MGGEAEKQNIDVEVKKSRENIIHIILAWLSLLPILAWPMVFLTSIMIVDVKPYDLSLWAGTLYGAMNAYPLCLIGNAVLSRWLFKKNKRTPSFVFVLWPTVLVLLIFLLLISPRLFQ